MSVGGDTPHDKFQACERPSCSVAGVTDLELAFRLAVAAVSIAGPTVLYFGLWRFLMWLRDDELVERLAERGVIENPEPAAVDVLTTTTEGAGAQGCPHCGTSNLPGAPVCRSCHRDLE